jgi:hypothetical protein
VPLVAAAICPHPPLLVPELAAGAAHELDELRVACRSAIATLAEPAPEAVVVVGSGRRSRRHEAPFGGTLAPWGLERTIGAPGPAELPLSLLMGAYLAPDADEFYEVAADAPAQTCAARGAELVAGRRTALLIMGDGSACRTEKAPGYFDPRAEGFDAAVSAALAKADPAALLALDPALAADLRGAGRAPWQVLAGAAGSGDGSPGESLRGEVLFDDAPFGVCYLVARWR